MSHRIIGQLVIDFKELMLEMASGNIQSLPVLDDFYDGVTITDSTGRICYINKMQLKIDEIDKQMALGRYVDEVYRVDEGIGPTMQCLKNGTSRRNFAYFYRTHLGKMVNSIHNIFPLRFKGEIFGSICFIRDFQQMGSILEQLSEAEGNLSSQQSVSIATKVHIAQWENGTSYVFSDIVGENFDLLYTIDIARQASKSPSPVFLYGETGTGKELFAQSIHNESKRNRSNFIAINCAAIPVNLLEGILFGTTKGAFTGAMEKAGLFERANGGTLFLDELNSMPISLQVKLLRAVQECKIRRVGALEEIPFNLKIISGSNMNPYHAVETGHLRRDLLYRLGVVFICLPNLRDRIEDIELLSRHFIEKLNHYLGKNIPGIRPEVLDRFKAHYWPGNVRELEHVIEGAMNIIHGNEPIALQHISFHLGASHHQPPIASGPDTREVPATPAVGGTPTEMLVSRERGALPHQCLISMQAEQEQRIIRQALTTTVGNVARAARRLGLSPQLLNHKMKKYGIRRIDFLH